MWSVNTWIIIINIAVFVLDGVFLRVFEIGVNYLGGGMGPLKYIGHFSTATAIYELQVWRFITFQFLHAGIFHIFFNMLVLYFFGPMIESYLGSKRFLGFYLICGAAGAVAYLVLWVGGILLSNPAVPLIGASAGVFGVLIAGARIAPNTQVMLLIPPIPVSLRTLAWVLIGIAAFMVLTRGRNAGGEAAHLGGAAAGFMLIIRPHVLDWCNRLSVSGFMPKQLAQRAKQTSWQKRHQERVEMEREVDRILKKVNEQGLHSLSKKEKRILQRATQQRRGS
jgi:membrane associated rhomboid family serine protease